MLVRYPACYREFFCIGGDCPDSCCHQWEVEVDDATANRYRAMAGPLGDDLRRALYEEDGHIYLRNDHDRCPMWRADGLCRIQAELGHGALCQVCQNFPRLRHDYGDFVELGLELSCPQAAKLLLHGSMDWVEEEAPGGEAPEYDAEVMALLQASRPVALALLSEEAYTIPQRLSLLLLYAYHIQTQIDGAEPAEFDPAAALQEAADFAGTPDVPALAQCYQDLEHLTARWPEGLKALGMPRWTEAFAAFGRYFVARHWFQAVSDYDLTGRVKLLLSACALLSRIPGDFDANAQLWSKEIENSADNLYALLDSAYTHPALTDANLLALLYEA